MGFVLVFEIWEIYYYIYYYSSFIRFFSLIFFGEPLCRAALRKMVLHVYSTIALAEVTPALREKNEKANDSRLRAKIQKKNLIWMN